MKNTIKYSILCLSVVAITSCVNTLDTSPTTTFDAETVWGSKSTILGYIYGAYDSILPGCSYAGSGTCQGWEARTPNSAYCSQVGEGIDNYATELSLSASNDWGSNRFSYLRMANLIIANVAESDAIGDDDRTEMLGHGYLLRGMIFFEQARKMGRFVPVCEVFDTENPEAANIAMTSSVAESYEYVISDLQLAAEYLPERNDYGMPTKWAADVILSRAALQAYAYTSDDDYLDIAINACNDVINNSGVSLSDSDGLFNESDLYNSEILWGYYRETSDSYIGDFDELIRVYPNISVDNQTVSLCPNMMVFASGAATFEGWAIYFPTQDMVDQYLVTDEATGEALPWYETSQYTSNVDILDPATVTTAGQVDAYQRSNGEDRRIPSPQDLSDGNSNYDLFTSYHQLKDGVTDVDISDLMYTGRDNRFYTNIVYDKDTWCGEYVEMNLAGNLSQGVRDKEDGGWYNTTTGYYWKKNTITDPDPRAYYSCNVATHYNIARLGEAYMNLAEAYLCKGQISNAVDALNQTRTVHGGLAASTASTEEEAWEDYIRERNCELCNEGGDIYFSYLRWGKYGGYANHGRSAGDVIYDLDRPVYKIQMSRDRSQLLIGQLTLLNSAARTFTTRRYLLPINQSFLDTREAYGLDHTQNEGY